MLCNFSGSSNYEGDGVGIWMQVVSLLDWSSQPLLYSAYQQGIKSLYKYKMGIQDFLTLTLLSPHPLTQGFMNLVGEKVKSLFSLTSN